MSDEHKRDINDILDDYADGRLGPEESQELLDAIKASPEIRERLAIVTIIERLLHAPTIKPHAVQTILDALPGVDTLVARELRKDNDGPSPKRKKLIIKKAKPGNRRIKKAKRKVWNSSKSSYRQDSPLAVLIVLTICAGLAVGLWLKVDRRQTTDRGLRTTDSASTPAANTPGQAEVRGQGAVDSASTLAANTPEQADVSEPLQPHHHPTTITLEDVDAAEGFIPPPVGLKKYVPVKLEVVMPGARGAPVPQVFISKLERGSEKRWNATPNDIDNVLKELATVAGFVYTGESMTLDWMQSSNEQRPIIYFSTHYKFTFDDGERKWLRAYMLNGGTVIFNAGLGSLPAYKSAVRELKIIFPENAPHPLSSDHPIYRSYFNLQRVEYGKLSQAAKESGHLPRLDGVTLNCRMLALVSRWGLSIGWEGVELPKNAAYLMNDARKIGINMITYTIAQRAWAKQVAGMKFEGDAEFGQGKMKIAQVKYDGEWKTRRKGLSLLLQTFNRKTEVPVKFGVQQLKLTDPKIFNAPLLYMTGHGDFYLSNEEAGKLRTYLKNGGFLFAESCCGRKGFDKAFRAEIERVFEGKTLESIPSNSSIYAYPNKIGKIAVTPSLSAKLGGVLQEPVLEGIKQDGHYAVIYSKYGMAGGWEMSQNPYADGYNDAGAIRLGQNILMYAITQ